MKTKIPYVDYSWNVFAGCSKVSKGCLNCFAEKMACRLKEICLASNKNPQYLSVVKDGKWTGKIEFNENMLERPLHWKKPRHIFLNSMSDTFHKNAPFEWIDKIMAIIALTSQHQYLIFTKRYERMFEYFTSERMINLPLKNLTLVHSYCNQEDFNKGWRYLTETPTAKYGISFEPLLGHIDFGAIYRNTHKEEQPDFIIIGAESIGSHAGRECKIEDVESLVEQADSAGIKVYVKQLHINGKLEKDISKFPKHLQRREFPK